MCVRLEFRVEVWGLVQRSNRTASAGGVAAGLLMPVMQIVVPLLSPFSFIVDVVFVREVGG